MTDSIGTKNSRSGFTKEQYSFVFFKQNPVIFKIRDILIFISMQNED